MRNDQSNIRESAEESKDLLLPERRLWVGVIEGAVDDLKRKIDMDEFKRLSGLPSSVKRKNEKYQKMIRRLGYKDEARRFLFSNDLNIICDLFLNVHGDFIRRGLDGGYA